jgi:sulfatase maturation enzyme AslB (radical SAM superfamily)
MRDLRQEFRNGAKPKGCETCIVNEANGYTSKRNLYSGDMDYDSEPDVPVEYQMILSNACNLKCRSCSPSHSSLWQAEHKVLWGHTGFKMPHGQSGENDSVLWNKRDEWMSSLKRLEIVGGEPFYIKRWRILWDELIDQGLSKNIQMDMSSNATLYEGEVVENLIANFKGIGLGLSVDGMGKVYDYLRHPGVWAEVKDNMLKYHEIKKRSSASFIVSVSHTIGWVNAWELPEFHTFIKNETPQFVIWNNIIHSPEHMAIWCIPARLKQRIQAKWQTYDWGKYKNDIEGIITYMNSRQPTDDELLKHYQVFATHDKLRDENLLEILPAEIVEEIMPYV